MSKDFSRNVTVNGQKVNLAGDHPCRGFGTKLTYNTFCFYSEDRTGLSSGGLEAYIDGKWQKVDAEPMAEKIIRFPADREKEICDYLSSIGITVR
jgi:hypothetical protein